MKGVTVICNQLIHIEWSVDERRLEVKENEKKRRNTEGKEMRLE